MYRRVKCPHCINGYVMTGYGPKPCMYCKGTQEITVEVPDPQPTKPSYSSQLSESNWDTDSSSDTQVSWWEGLKGCLTFIILAGAFLVGTLWLMSHSF